MDISQKDFEPIRYQPPLPPPPPPPRQSGGWKPWMTALSVCCGLVLILFIVMMGMLFRFLNREDVKEVIASMPRNAQPVGSTFAWRRIYSPDMPLYGYVSPVVGNFDDDPVAEILLLESNSTSMLVELSGSCRTVSFKAEPSDLTYRAWDWDGDGIDEVFSEAMNGDPNIEIFNLNGELVHTIKNRRITGDSIVGDYDGDSRPDLLLQVADYYTACVHRQKGLEQIIGQTYYEGTPYCLADLDGDGQKEVVVVTNNNYYITSTAGTQSPPWNTLKPAWAVDLSGQGVDWLVDLAVGILDPSTGEITPLQWPEDLDRPEVGGYEWRFGLEDVAAFKPPGETEPQLAVATGEFGSHLLLFDKTGELVYHQSFFDSIQRMTVVDYLDGQMLLLVMDTGILAYP